MNKILLAVILPLLLLLFVGTVYVFMNDLKGPEQIACTEEAKICPDGSAVGRTGARCEFAECPSPIFGNSVYLNIGQEVSFGDGLKVVLTAINDSRCKEGVVCVWQGELSPVLEVSGGDFGQNTRQITLGSSTRLHAIEGRYSFVLSSVTEVQAVVTIDNNRANSYRNLDYIVEGKAVTLVNGISEVETAPGSSSVTTTSFFGNEAYGDLNGDKQDDVAFYLTQETEGTGIFYYLVAVIGDKATNAVFIGDRIAPQNSRIESGAITINYAERSIDEAMTDQPSLGVSRIFKVVNGKLTEQKNSACYIGGCSSEICSDQKNMVSTCIYKDEYICYADAQCARQSNGQCGWTKTDELTQCLQESQ